MYSTHHARDYDKHYNAFNRYLPVDNRVEGVAKSDASYAIGNHVTAPNHHDDLPVFFEERNISE
jgi:hypothetical protein